MYRLTRDLTWRNLATRELPTGAGALVCAELFYRFHSFVLEAAAFLATWYVLDAVVHRLVRDPGRAGDADAGTTR